LKESIRFVFVSILFTFILSLTSSSFSSPLDPDRDNFCSIIPGIEYHNQNEKGGSEWCVVYSTVMLLSRYEIFVTPEEVAEHFYMKDRQTPYFSLRSVFSGDGSIEKFLQDEYNLKTKKKIFVTLRSNIKEWMKSMIQAGNPVLIIYGSWQGHAILMVGCNEKYIFINDPSGAFFSEAKNILKKDMYPKVWAKDAPVSIYESVGVPWKDFEQFIAKRNAWGYMIAVVGNKDDDR